MKKYVADLDYVKTWGDKDFQMCDLTDIAKDTVEDLYSLANVSIECQREWIKNLIIKVVYLENAIHCICPEFDQLDKIADEEGYDQYDREELFRRYFKRGFFEEVSLQDLGETHIGLHEADGEDL